MKIKEILEKEEKKGTYAGVHFSAATKKAIAKFCKDHKIPNAVDPDKLHSTVLFSRKYLPKYDPAGMYDPKMVGTPTGWDVWKTTPEDPNDEKTNCLILKFDCPELSKRHKELMKQHDATYDYDVYKTHVTLSYNIGDFDTKDLPLLDADIEIESEYGEDLNLGWAKTA